MRQIISSFRASLASSTPLNSSPSLSTPLSPFRPTLAWKSVSSFHVFTSISAFLARTDWLRSHLGYAIGAKAFPLDPSHLPFCLWRIGGREGVCKTKGIDIWMVAHIVFSLSFFLVDFECFLRIVSIRYALNTYMAWIWTFI